jgi:hypothetical protein
VLRNSRYELGENVIVQNCRGHIESIEIMISEKSTTVQYTVLYVDDVGQRRQGRFNEDRVRLYSQSLWDSILQAKRVLQLTGGY